MKFAVGEMLWSAIPYENGPEEFPAFDGTIRYASCCFVPPAPDAHILVTGGCHVTNGYPTNNVALFTIDKIRYPKSLRPMLLKRSATVPST